MPVMIAMLRAVNVGGRNGLNMDELRTLCVALGHKDVQTYLQSGNVVFRCTQPGVAKVAAELEAAVADALGVETVVIGRTPTDLRGVVAGNPFAERNLDPSKVMVAYFQTRPAEEVVAKAAARRMEPDEIQFAGREAYIYYPNGQGKAAFNWSAFERASKIPATARNWSTTLKLLQISEAIQG